MYKKIPAHLLSFNIITGEAEGFNFENPKICHGSGGGSGSTNTVTSAAPPQQVLDAYQTALNAGQSAASAPLQQYNAPTIAGFTPDQTSAFNTVDSAQGVAQPYYNAAQNDINAGTANLWNGVQQFSPSSIQQYQSPYTQNVLNTTMASEQNQDAQQQAALQGNAISSGAWGGDRAGVASAVLSGQQALANNSTNANIENTGYNTALGEFNTQQQNQLGANEANAYLSEQAGLGLGNLGTTAENQALTGASAQESSGAIQQQLGQAALNVPYEQFEQQQAYPLQTAQYFANIAEGIGAGAGGLGSSTTTAAAPSVASQVAGFGLGGLGIYGALNSGSGASGAADAVANRGGRIGMHTGGALGTRKGYAFGGLTTGVGLGDSIAQSSQIPNISMSFVPSPMGGRTSGGRGAGGPPEAQSSKTTGGGQQQSNLPPGSVNLAAKGAKALYHALNKPPADLSDAGGQDALDPSSSSALDMQGEVNPLDTTQPGGGWGASAGASSDVPASEVGTPYAAPYVDVPGGAYAGPTIVDGDAGGAGGAVGGSGAFDAAGSGAAAGTAASGAADSTLASGALDAAGAGSTAGIIDGASAAAAVDSGIAEAGADVAGAEGAEVASDAALLLLAAKRGGRIEALGTRRSKHYDGGGQVGGQTPMSAASAATGPMQQTYNSSYQNMTPQQLQQILIRLPPGSQQQQSAQAVLKQKEMMPNVGAQAQGGFGSQTAQVPPTGAPQQAPQQQAQPAMARGGPAHFAVGGGMGLPPPIYSLGDGSNLPDPYADITNPHGPRHAKYTGKAARGGRQHFDDGGLVDNGIYIPNPPPPDQSVSDTPSGALGSGRPSAPAMPSVGGMGSSQMVASAAPPTEDSDYSTEEPPNTRAKAKADPWLALAAAGFGMAAGTSPNAGVNIGRGAQEGLQNYTQQQKEADNVNESADKLMAEAKQHKDQIAMEQQQRDLQKQQIQQTGAYQQGELENQRATLKQKELIKDAFGQPMGWADPATGRVIPLQGAVTGSLTPPTNGALQPSSASAQPVGGVQASSLPDDVQERLSHYPATAQPTILGVLQGRIPPTRQYLGSNPQAFLQAASDVDPSFDVANPTVRMKTAADYSPAGKTGQQLTALENTSRHGAAAALAAIDLNNGSSSWNPLQTTINEQANKYEAGRGDPRLGNYNSYLGNYGHEAMKVISGKTNPGEAETAEFMKPMDPSGAPGQILGALSAKNEMALAVAQDKQEAYDTAMGPYGQKKQLITPQAQQAFNDIDTLASAAKEGTLKSPEAIAARTRLQTWAKPVMNTNGQGSGSATPATVRMINPATGIPGTIPAAEAQEAIKNGWKPAGGP